MSDIQKDVILNEVGMFGEMDLEDPTEMEVKEEDKKKER